MVELTTFARKYGVRPEHEDQWGLFYLYGKSGIFPLAKEGLLLRRHSRIYPNCSTEYPHHSLRARH
jgi:hypothetical protein